jgi:hypothetical protein
MLTVDYILWTLGSFESGAMAKSEMHLGKSNVLFFEACHQRSLAEYLETVLSLVHRERMDE